jgi:hypothetical protein
LAVQRKVSRPPVRELALNQTSRQRHTPKMLGFIAFSTTYHLLNCRSHGIPSPSPSILVPGQFRM